MRLLAFFLSLFTVVTMNAQWSGTYYGAVNGDPVVMNLTQSGKTITGDMKDSQQTYTISGTVSGDNFSGSAIETTYALTFGLSAVRTKNVLDCNLTFDLNGEHAEVPFTVEKAGEASGEQTVTATETAPEKIPFPADANFPVALQGTWTKSETYNSGYGDNYMGSTFSQSMTFFADGSISDGGSSATMSGSDYSGQSSDSGSGKLPGVGWYAKKNNLYLIAFAEGKWQSVLLGTWYTENNHLLITGTNGEKQLFGR